MSEIQNQYRLSQLECFRKITERSTQLQRDLDAIDDFGNDLEAGQPPDEDLRELLPGLADRLSADPAYETQRRQQVREYDHP